MPTHETLTADHTPSEWHLLTIIIMLLAVIEHLRCEIAALKRVRPHNENTPSSTIAPFLKPNHRQRKKKPGRKPGTTKGSRRPRPERIDQVRDHTLKACPRCQHPLSEDTCCEVKVRYTEDIRIERVVSEDRIHYYRCPDCREKVHDFAKALPKCTFGVNLMILVVTMRFGLGLSYHAIQRWLKQAADIGITTGALIQISHRLAGFLAPVYEDIRQQAQKSAYLHADETGWRISGLTAWLWCFCNKHLCLYLIQPSRGSPVIKKVLGDIFEGVLISDFFAAYGVISAMAKQKCFAHLLRTIHADQEKASDPGAFYVLGLVKRLLRDAIQLAANRNELVADVYARRRDRMHKRLNRIITGPYASTAWPDIKRVIKRVTRFRHDLLTFLDHPEVSADNNRAEREIRPAVVARKMSFGNHSQKGADTQTVLMTIIRTAVLQGHDPKVFLKDALISYIRTGSVPRDILRPEKSPNPSLRQAA